MQRYNSFSQVLLLLIGWLIGFSQWPIINFAKTTLLRYQLHNPQSSHLVARQVFVTNFMKEANRLFDVFFC